MVQIKQAEIITLPPSQKVGSGDKLSKIPAKIRLHSGLDNEWTFILMGKGGMEDCGENVTNHRLDKPSGTNYKDKVSTRQIVYTNPLRCTQEVEQQPS